MKKEQVIYVLSVMLEEFANPLWIDALMSWDLTGDNSGGLYVTISVYEDYSISQNQLKKLVDKFFMGEIEYNGISFRTKNGVLEICIDLSSKN